MSGLGINNSYYVTIRNPSERKYCGSGFHGSDNAFLNMQVSKPILLKKLYLKKKLIDKVLDLKT